MNKLAFISRHTPTAEQYELAHKANYLLEAVGDMDAFSPCLVDTLKALKNAGYIGVVCVHPLIAMQAREVNLHVGIFKNDNRAPEGEKPTFYATELHILYTTTKIVEIPEIVEESCRYCFYLDEEGNCTNNESVSCLDTATIFQERSVFKVTVESK